MRGLIIKFTLTDLMGGVIQRFPDQEGNSPSRPRSSVQPLVVCRWAHCQLPPIQSPVSYQCVLLRPIGLSRQLTEIAGGWIKITIII